MKLLITVFALLLAVSAQAQDFKFLPWSADKWNSSDGLILRSDKAEHVIRDGAIFWALGKTNLVGQYRFGVTTLLATGWEIRDGFAWRKTDGFSFKDILAGMAGQVIVFGAEQLFDKPKQKHDEALRKELNQIGASEKATPPAHMIFDCGTMPPFLDVEKSYEVIPCPDGILGCAVNHVMLFSRQVKIENKDK